ncbi:MAG TPA: LysE family translocator [Rhodanobacteraceae bacterium]
MTSLLPIAMFLSVAAITPGPNNLVVMRTAMRNGWTGVLPTMAGIVTGGLALLALVTVGAGGAFQAWPWLRATIEIGGAVYLVSMGVRLFSAAGHDDDKTPLPIGLPGLFGFQFLNPKGWVMVLTAVAAMPSTAASRTFLELAPLFVLIPIAGLAVWAGLGGVLASRLIVPAVRRWTDRTLSALLILAALLLFV